MLIESNARDNFRNVAITRHAKIAGGYYASISILKPRKVNASNFYLASRASMEFDGFKSLGKYMEQPSGMPV